MIYEDEENPYEGRITKTNISTMVLTRTIPMTEITRMTVPTRNMTKWRMPCWKPQLSTVICKTLF